MGAKVTNSVDEQVCSDVAIVGMAGRFPDAKDIETLWRNLLDKHIASSKFTTDELIGDGLSREIVESPDYVTSAPVLENAEHFDAGLFKVSAAEAELIDPQQRQLLEVSWQAFENAGYDPARVNGPVATFAGTAMNTYALHTGLSEHFFHNYLSVLLGSDKDYTATRIAYKLGLTGPAMTVQSACSTSLVAIHQAIQCLLNHEADMALVGAASVRCPLKTGHLAQEGSVFSTDGVCRPFDADAKGTVFGSGVGALLLKRLEDAVADGDNIRAVIKGSAVNNDGKNKSDFTAPTVGKQAECVLEALGAAEIEADTISYVEAHGTGTFVGDPIEIEALSRAFRLDTDKVGFCGLGSIKGNIGHLDAAAGMASIIKVTRALEEKTLPPSGGYHRPNPQINFQKSPFFVVDQQQPWDVADGLPRRAGISSLGMGGTNSHVVIEEFVQPNRPKQQQPTDPVILQLSAATSSAIDAQIINLADHLECNPHLSLNDVAYTLQQGRAQLEHRAAVVASNVEQAIASLRNTGGAKILKGRVIAGIEEKLFMFPGQGSQYPAMGSRLYQQEPVYRKFVDIAESILVTEFAVSIIDLLSNPDCTEINHTQYAQPALYVSSYASAMLLQSWGIEPSGLIGHSVGEYVAAALSSVFSYEDGLRLVAHRGRIMQSAPAGSMLMVTLPADEVARALPDDTEIAVVNSTASCVIAGPESAILDAADEYNKIDVVTRSLQTSHAFHSKMMDEAVTEFTEVLRTFRFTAPRLKFISCVTGDWISAENAVSVEYWARQLRYPVQFSKALEMVYKQPVSLTEVGPGVVLSMVAKAHVAKGEKHCVNAIGRHPSSTVDEQLLAHSVLAHEWIHQGKLKREISGYRVELPSYPFEGKPYWFVPETNVNDAQRPVQVSSSATDWIQQYGWSYFSDSKLTGSSISAPLLQIIVFDPGTRLKGLTDSHEFNRQAIAICDDESSIGKTLTANANTPIHFVYVPVKSDFMTAEDLLHHCFEARFNLLRTVAQQMADGSRLTLVTFNAIPVFDDVADNLSDSFVTGMLPVFDAEFPHIDSSHIDIADRDGFLPKVVQHLKSPVLERQLCLKENRWWRKTFEKIQLVKPIRHAAYDTKLFCHVVAGAFGGIGRELALHLSRQCGKLILVGRVDQEREDYGRKIAREAGIEVVTLDLDINSKMDCNQIALEVFRSRSYKPGSVFHLAGYTADGLIVNKKIKQSRSVMKAKIHGTQNLYDAVVRSADMRMVLFSSVAAHSGPVGQVDYAAANAYQLLFAQGNKNVVGIAWPGWKGTGMLSRVTDENALKEIAASAIETHHGLKIIDDVLESTDHQGVLVVSREHFDAPGGTVLSQHQGDVLHFPKDDIVDTSATGVVTSAWKKILKEKGEIHPSANFFDLGGNSMLATRTVSYIKEYYGVAIPMKEALERVVLSDWIELYNQASSVAVKPAKEVSLSDHANAMMSFGEVPCVAGISRFLARRPGTDFNQWNLAVMLECQQEFNKKAMLESLLILFNHHDMLRAQIEIIDTPDEATARCHNISIRKSVSALDIETIDLSEVSDGQLPLMIEKHANECQRQFSLLDTLLFRVVHFNCGENRPDRILMYVHHFVADGLSWTIILTDLQSIYSSTLKGLEAQLSFKTTSYEKWATSMAQLANSSEFVDHSKYWRTLSWDRTGELPMDLGDASQNTNASGTDVQLTLDARASSQLAELSRSENINLTEILIAGFVKAIYAWAAWPEKDHVLIDVMGHGRDLNEKFDVTRTVGFFNSYCPLLIDARPNIALPQCLPMLCEEINAMLANGNLFDLARYVSKAPEVLDALDKSCAAKILFNYIGNLKNNNAGLLDENHFKVATESHGSIHSEKAMRDHLLAMRIEHVEANLQMTLVYSGNIHKKKNMERLLSCFEMQLRQMTELDLDDAV